MPEGSELDILACPVCKGLIESEVTDKLVCRKCNLTYRIQNNIPVLLPEKISCGNKSRKVYLASLEIGYHLMELEIARDPKNKYYIMPEFKDEHKIILDIGCGIGQTFTATNINADKNRLLIGLDPDLRAMEYGKKSFKNIRFIGGLADYLPFKNNSVDLVISRVSLPYSDLRISFSEIERVLKPGGEFWVTLHPTRMVFSDLFKAAIKFNVRSLIYRMYVLVNGTFFHWFGKLYYFPGSGRMESFQTGRAIKRVLKKNGFINVEIKKNLHFLITGKKRI